MIEWIKYGENIPELNQEHIIYTSEGFLKVAELEIWANDDEGEYVWIENQEFIRVRNVTHYAKINLPE